MKLATLRRSRVDGLSGVTGVARLDRRTKRLAGRLNPGDIAIIDHVDLVEHQRGDVPAGRTEAHLDGQHDARQLPP